MGADRIKKNLSLDEVDVVEWCKSKILSEKAEISKQGKEIRRIIIQKNGNRGVAKF